MTDSRFNDLFNVTSIVSLVFQISGTALIAFLSFVVSRAVRRRLMLYWTAGWTAYTAALVAIMFAFRVGQAGVVLLFAYYFFEYAAILMVYAGCRYTSIDEPPPRRIWWLLGPAALVAALLVGPPDAFFWRFAIHAAIVGAGWAACLVGLWPALRRDDAGPGVRIVAAGLVLLSLDYLHHLPVAWYNTVNHQTLTPYYYTIMSLVDGMLEFVLGFGTVVVIVDKVRAELQRVNFGLKVAHDRTEDALHTDPLTQAFSRYSFDAMFGGAEEASNLRGCIAVVDLDGLKSVNDRNGHAAGDAAICAVADGLRTLVRHEDRVYRLGGDEFVVIMLGIPADLARRRLAELNNAINHRTDDWHGPLETLAVSWGVAEFCESTTVKSAVAAADAAMYAVKAEKRQRERSPYVDRGH